MERELTPFEALEEAVFSAGSQSAFARNLGVSQTAVWKWLQKSKQLPAEYVLRTEQLYGVSRHLLRPDIYPIDLPPFVSHDKTVTSPERKDPCNRHASLQRGDGAEQMSASAPTTHRQENRND